MRKRRPSRHISLDMSDEMAKLASRCDMPMLCYFLNLARAEADMRARELGGYPIDRSA
jgi:hypothetical protein